MQDIWKYVSMREELISVIDFYLEDSFPREEAIRSIGPHLSVVEKTKGTILIEEGSYHNYAYFLLEGVVRSYYLKEGTEVNIWFAFEEEMLGSLQNYVGKPSNLSVELLEDCRLISLQLDSMREATKGDLILNVFIRKIMEEYAEFLEERLFGYQHMSSMDRYNHLLETDKEILERVSLTHVASYLGMSRETLSRLRGKRLL